MSKELRSLITSDEAMRQIELALPEHVNASRWARAVLTCLNRVPKLAQCNRASFVNAMMDCAELGLEPNGRDAHFVPYGSQCQLIVDYRGLVKLAYQSGQVSSIRADVVYEGDEFDYKTCDHIPYGWRVDAPAERGSCIGAYVVIDKKDGSVHRERMTHEEIEKIRKRSKAGSSGPWKTDWEEMAKKTVFRRASKWIQLNPHVEKHMDRDFDTPDFESERRASATIDPKKFLSMQAEAATEQSEASDDDFQEDFPESTE